jgi:hypothetical protein
MTFLEPETGSYMFSPLCWFANGSRGRRVLGAGFPEYGRPGKTKQIGLIERS